MNNIKAVLFDLDGTLTDTERVYQRNWIKAAKECGYADFSEKEALSLRSAWSVYGKKLMVDRFGSDFNYDKVHDKCALYTRKELEEKGIELKPGAKEILEYLQNKKVKIALVTAGRLEVAVPRVKSIGLYEYFDKCISAHNLNRGKPYPDPYEYACKEVGVLPEETFAIEDSPNGAKSAIDAGCNTIMVPDLTKPDQELKNKLFDCVENLYDLMKLI